MSDAFYNADFYDCSDVADELRHTSPEECIGEYLHGLVEKGDICAEISKFAPLEVEAYKRAPISLNLVARNARSLVEILWDNLCEEDGYAFCGHDCEGFSDEQTSELVDGFAAVIKKILEEQQNFYCLKVAMKTYTADELIALMREHMPEWFEVES